MRLLLAVLCLLLVYLVNVGEGHVHECGHVPPQRVGYTATTSSRTRRQATERQPIRIVPVFYKEDFNQLTPELKIKYMSVAEDAIDYLSSFLKVEPLTQNITLQRFCDISARQLPVALSELNPYDHCTPDEPCLNDTFCAYPDFPIPEEHLKACKTCESFGSTNCATDEQDGPGVANADFVVYVAARSFQCGNNMLAYAAHCFHDMNTDRPIAGVINLCPKLATEEDIDSIVQTLSHELTHAMVFSPRLMPFYRDENGNPRTPRNETTGLPSLGDNPIFLFQPSADTILEETVRREALNGMNNIHTVKVVTPAVLREARSHFNCPTLKGMELENLGGEVTRYGHWKKRLVENEEMTGVDSINSVFSRLTFALYEDSGCLFSVLPPSSWYDVDYSVASLIRFGQCLGCDFAEQSCFTYGLGRQPFCNVQEVLPYSGFNREGGTNSSCSYDRRAVGFCDLVNLTRFGLSAPIQYQYFLDPNLGGLEATNDYCPVHSAKLHCQHQRNLGSNVFLESVGPNSKCVDFEIRTEWEYDSVTNQPIYGGACYEVSCASEGSVSITVGGSTVLCQSVGQEMTFQAGGFNITILCPAFEDICWEMITTCPTTTSAPPSGLTQGGAIAIGVIFGLLSLVTVAVIAALVMVVTYKYQKGRGKGSSRRSKAPVSIRDSYQLIGDASLEKEA